MNGAVRSGARVAVQVVIVLLAGLPFSFVFTFALVPLWRWVEGDLGIESIGHSGPAEWCFWLSYAIGVIAGLFLVMKSTRKAPPK
jgi:hypothetical protein